MNEEQVRAMYAFESERFGLPEISLTFLVSFVLFIISVFVSTIIQLDDSLKSTIKIIIFIVSILLVSLAFYRRYTLYYEYLRYLSVRGLMYSHNAEDIPENHREIINNFVPDGYPVDVMNGYNYFLSNPDYFLTIIETFKKKFPSDWKNFLEIKKLSNKSCSFLERYGCAFDLLRMQVWLAKKKDFSYDEIKKQLSSPKLEKRALKYLKDDLPEKIFSQDILPIKILNSVAEALREIHNGGMVLMFFTMVTALLMGNLSGLPDWTEPLIIISGIFYLITFPSLSSTFVIFTVKNLKSLLIITLWLICFLFNIITIIWSMLFFI